MSFITKTEVIRQLKKDLIGKDSYRGVTLTYSWLANQFGHFSLGFIPTVVIYHFIKDKPGINYPELWASLGVWLAWILFEVYNFLGPLLLKVPTQLTALSRGQYTFRPSWLNLAFDTATDIVYFGIGAITASLLCHYHPQALITLIILLALVSYPAYYWYTTKMYLQNAEYPFQLRLSQWNQNIRPEHKAAVLNFLNDKDQGGKHMLIFGSRGSGKTSLSVSIATEASINSNCCSYITAVKLLSLFYDTATPPQHINKLWSWRNCNLLVIDDINPGKPVKSDIITTELFYEILNNVDCGPDNLKHIRDKNIIWVMGSDDPTNMLEEKWERLLQQIGIPKSKITTIDLD